MNYNKFCAILSHQRSGTHLLGTCLNSHPDILYADEVFDGNKIAEQNKLNNFLKRYEGRNKLVCLDVKYNHITRPIENLLEQIKVIHLIRYDLKKMYISDVYHRYILQSYSDRFANKSCGERVRIYQEIAKTENIAQPEIDEQGLNRWSSVVTSFRRRYNYLAGITIFYENLTNGQSISQLPEEETQKICEFLRVSYQSLTTQMIKEENEIRH